MIFYFAETIPVSGKMKCFRMFRSLPFHAHFFLPFPLFSWCDTSKEIHDLNEIVSKTLLSIAMKAHFTGSSQIFQTLRPNSNFKSVKWWKVGKFLLHTSQNVFLSTNISWHHLGSFWKSSLFIAAVRKCCKHFWKFHLQDMCKKKGLSFTKRKIQGSPSRHFMNKEFSFSHDL